MKVVHIIDSMGFGGAERSLSIYLPELFNLGLRSEIMCFHKTCREIRIPGKIPVRYFPRPSDIGEAKKRAWLRQVCAGADIVHTHLNFSTLLARKALATSPIPIITTLHTTLYAKKYLQTYPWPGRWKVRWMRWREKQTLGPKTFLLAVSQAVGDGFCRYANLAPDRLRVISNAIHPSFFQSQARKFPQAKFKGSLLAVGRLAPEKNHTLVLQALTRIPKPFRPRFEIFGEGALRTQLQSLADQAKLDLSMPGLKTDLHREFLEGGIFINASKLEGQALVVLEAMASGLPCLLSDIPPHREVAGDAALYFPADDAGACASLLQRLQNDPDLQVELAAKARARAQISRPEVVAQKLLQYYHAVLAGKVPAARSGAAGSALPPP